MLQAPISLLAPGRSELVRACGVLLALVLTSTVYACGGCYRLPYRTLLEKMESSDRVVVAQAVNNTGTWKIDRVLKGKDVAGATIQVQQTGASSAQLLRFSVDAWEITAPADPQLVRFLAGALLNSNSAGETPTIRQRAQQLRYYLPYLEHPDANIADSTHARFASAPYRVLTEISADLDRDKALAWIEDQSAAINTRVALYVTLLGLCGNERDARRIKNWIDQEYTGGEASYLTALLTAHIETEGEQAVRFIETSYIRKPNRQLGEVIAAVDALRTHGQAKTVVSRDRIKASFHLLLRERPPLAELVIDDFARWEDWSIAPVLIEIYQSGRQPWNNALITKYLRACPLPTAKNFLRHASGESH